MIKKAFKIITNNIELILLILILVASVLFIRNNNFSKYMLISINTTMLVYLLIHIIRKNPIKIIKSKLDIFIILFTLAVATPLICNTYISLSATVTAIINYITLFWIYILTREAVCKNEKSISYISNIIIFGVIFLIIIGIENLSSNIIFSICDINYIINGEDRLVSLLGNPNSFSAIIAFAYFLGADRLIKSTSAKAKVLYSTANTILILGFILTYSKAMYIIFPIMLIVYIFLLKEKKNIAQVLQNTISSIIMAIVYTYMFSSLVAREEYLAVLVLSVLGIIIAIIVNITMLKMQEYIEKIKLKNIIIIIIILCIIATIWLVIELNNGTTFVVFEGTSNSSYNAKKIKNIQPNQKYTFSFDMEAESNLGGDYAKDLFSINIIQRDNKNKEITNKEESFESWSGIKEIEIETSENTAEIKIEFKVKYEHVYKQWYVHELKVNGKKVILEYKHLPTKLIEKISDININYKTAQERIQFIKDGLKLIKQNFLTGIGDSGWQLKYKEVQEYGYISNDTHSYIIQLWLEYGILSIISLIAIIVFILKDRNANIAVKLAVMTLLLHSVIDSDMLYVFMRILLFTGLGIIACNNKKQKVGKIETYTNVGLIVFTIIILVLTINPQIYNKMVDINKIKETRVGMRVDSDEYREINRQLVKKHEEIVKYERSNLERLMFETNKLQYAITANENVEKYLFEYYENMLVYDNKVKCDTNRIIEKSSSICNIIQLIENLKNPKLYDYIVKLSKINIDEYENTKNMLEKQLKAEYDSENVKENYEKFIENYKYSLEKYNQYILGISVKNATKIDITDVLEHICDEDIEIANKTDVLIYHTHTTEAYNEEYEETEYGKTLDSNYNVIKVGNTLTETLQSMGFNVIHVSKYHDLEGINGAYKRSYETVKNELDKQNSDIEIVFDIHRDAFVGTSNETNCVEIEGKKAAKLRFIIAIEHDNWEENLKWAVELQKIADEMYPGLFETMYLYEGNYNQSVAKYATLIEVGNEMNTLEEANQSMKYFSDVIKHFFDIK